MIRSIRIRAAAGLVIAGLFLAAFFSGAQPVHAQLCDGSGLSGPITVTGYKGCAIPERDWRDPKNPGTANAPCVVSGAEGGTITAFCSAAKACCELRSASGAKGALKSFGSGATGSLLQQLTQLLQQLMQGGSGGGSGGGGRETPASPNFEYGTGGTDDNFLELDSSLRGEDDDFNLNAIFGDEGEDESGPTNDKGELDEGIDTETDTVSDFGDSDIADQQEQNQEGESGDASESKEVVSANVVDSGREVGVTYTNVTNEETQGRDSNTTGFEADFANTTFEPSIDDSRAQSNLTLQELEAAGLLEAYRIGATDKRRGGSLSVPYESLTPAEIRSLQDYNNSVVAVSGKLSPFQGNPLSNERYDLAVEDAREQDDSVLVKIAKFFGALFGLGSPRN
tara:strand:- start:14656 stop:15843 length:1188 start_codon:yes stop_codon:yes gene_type:complete